MAKISKTKQWDETHKKWNNLERYPGKKHLVIDNTKLSAKKVAKKIVEYYGL